MLCYLYIKAGLALGELGAGNGSRTRVSTLARSHNSRYTIPANAYRKLVLKQARTI